MKLLRSLQNKLLSLAAVGESIALLHDLLTEIHEKQRTHQHQLDALFVLQKELKQTRFAQLLLLWQPTDTSQPGFASVGFEATPGTRSIELRVNVPVPEGAWLVAMGCYLNTVLVGNDLQDLAMPERSTVCKLRHPVQLGQIVRCVVSP